MLKLFALCSLCNIAVVVTDHLDEEGLGFTVACLGKDLLVDHVNNTLAVTSELVLNLVLVGGKSSSVLGVLGVLLNCG